MRKILRPIQIDGDTAYVELTKGYTAIISSIDIGLVGMYNWSVSEDGNTCYAKTMINGADGKRHQIRMHRIITDAPKDAEVDHINGNGLDNRRENLRLVTKSQNQHNANARQDSRSGLRGVSWDSQHKKWRAAIKCNGVRRYLGRFEDKHEAHKAYCAASKKLHGEYGRTE